MVIIIILLYLYNYNIYIIITTTIKNWKACICMLAFRGFCLVDKTTIAETRLPLFFIRSRYCINPRTLHPLWSAVAAGLARLRNHCLAEIRGDWAFLVEMFGLKAGYAHSNVCHLCRATQGAGELQYSCFGKNPPWKSTLRSKRDFYLKVLPPLDDAHVNPLVFLEGFGPNMLKPCLMHSCHLGVGLFTNGSCVKTMLKLGLLGNGSRESQFNKLWSQFVAWRKQHSVRAYPPRFRPFFLKDGEEQPIWLMTKAWHGRVVTAFLASALCEASQQDPSNALLALVSSCVWNLAELYNRIERAGRYLTSAAPGAAIHFLCVHMTSLALLPAGCDLFENSSDHHRDHDIDMAV